MQNDHDLLIRLDTQVQLVLAEIKDIKLNTTLKVGELDSRVNKIEKTIITENLLKRTEALEVKKNDWEELNPQDVKEAIQWTKDRKANWALTHIFVGFIGACLGIAAAWVAAVAHVLGH